MENQEPLIPLPLETAETETSPAQGEPAEAEAQTTNTDKSRRPRSKWTEQETQDLIKGCTIHGVGNWKKYFFSF
jgi:Myb-like DNA-binding domain